MLDGSWGAGKTLVFIICICALGGVLHFARAYGDRLKAKDSENDESPPA